MGVLRTVQFTPSLLVSIVIVSVGSVPDTFDVRASTK